MTVDTRKVNLKSYQYAGWMRLERQLHGAVKTRWYENSQFSMAKTSSAVSAYFTRHFELLGAWQFRGMLRFNYRSTFYVDDLVKEVQDQSLIRCQYCGTRGTRVVDLDGHYEVTCANHMKPGFGVAPEVKRTVLGRGIHIFELME